MKRDEIQGFVPKNSLNIAQHNNSYVELSLFKKSPLFLRRSLLQFYLFFCAFSLANGASHGLTMPRL